MKVTGVTFRSSGSAGVGGPAGVGGSAAERLEFRQRLLGALAASIAESGYRTTTVADIVRRARTSRRTFYEHFSSKEDCFVALLTGKNTETIAAITAAVDPRASRERQVRQAVEAWVCCTESEPAIMLAWIRDVPALGDLARRLQRDAMDEYVVMIQRLGETERWQAARTGPVPRQLAILLLGGLRELTATAVEDGDPVRTITETAVQASIALLIRRD